MGVTQLLITNFAIIMVAMMILWLYSIRIRDVSFIDAFWAFGMVMLAVSSYFQTEGDPARKWLLTGLCSLWGLRLASHLFTRWRAHGEDPRYKKILGHAMEKNRWSFGKASLIMVFAMQGPMLFIVCLPVHLGQVSTQPVGILAGIGAKNFESQRFAIGTDHLLALYLIASILKQQNSLEHHRAVAA